jgi:hypothetical protein
MRARRRICGVGLLALVTITTGGCVDAFVEGLARGVADGVALVVEDFITQLPGQDTE